MNDYFIEFFIIIGMGYFVYFFPVRSNLPMRDINFPMYENLQSMH